MSLITVTFLLEDCRMNLLITVIKDMESFCGIDKIHYSILKSQSAWSHIAKKLTSSLKTNVSPQLRTSELVLSIADNVARILLTDMFGIINKTEETF